MTVPGFPPLSPALGRLRIAAAYETGCALVKAAADHRPCYSLSGRLYLSSSGWLLLSVPNSLVRGVFDALDEAGAELPPGREGRPFEAHVTVMRPEELEAIGGAERVTERGKHFAYRVGGFSVLDDPAGWADIGRVWMLVVHSPELQDLRRSYGLSSLPKEGKHDFHITVAVRRRGVLGRNATAKGGDQTEGVGSGTVAFVSG